MSEAPQRMIRLLSLLQSRRDWTGDELADRLEVTPRTVRRDVERIRDLGYQVSASPGVAGGYRLASGRALPPLMLDEPEARAIALSLRLLVGGGVRGADDAALSALVKLEQVLPHHLRTHVTDVQTSVESYAAPTPIVESEVLGTAAAACRNSDEVSFEYSKRNSPPTTRTVHPHKVVHVGGRWYLISWDMQRKDWRTFRLDRITDFRSTGRSFEPRQLPADDAADYIRRQILSPLAPHHAQILFHQPYNIVADRLRVRDGVLKVRDPDSCVLRIAAESLSRLVASLVVIDIEFTVIEPVELETHLNSLAKRFAAAVVSRVDTQDPGEYRAKFS